MAACWSRCGTVRTPRRPVVPCRRSPRLPLRVDAHPPTPRPIPQGVSYLGVANAVLTGARAPLPPGLSSPLCALLDAMLTHDAAARPAAAALLAHPWLVAHSAGARPAPLVPATCAPSLVTGWEGGSAAAATGMAAAGGKHRCGAIGLLNASGASGDALCAAVCAVPRAATLPAHAALAGAAGLGISMLHGSSQDCCSSCCASPTRLAGSGRSVAVGPLRLAAACDRPPDGCAVLAGALGGAAAGSSGSGGCSNTLDGTGSSSGRSSHCAPGGCGAHGLSSGGRLGSAASVSSLAAAAAAATPTDTRAPGQRLGGPVHSPPPATLKLVTAASAAPGLPRLAASPAAGSPPGRAAPVATPLPPPQLPHEPRLAVQQRDQHVWAGGSRRSPFEDPAAQMRVHALLLVPDADAAPLAAEPPSPTRAGAAADGSAPVSPALPSAEASLAWAASGDASPERDQAGAPRLEKARLSLDIAAPSPGTGGAAGAAVAVVAASAAPRPASPAPWPAPGAGPPAAERPSRAPLLQLAATRPLAAALPGAAAWGQPRPPPLLQRLLPCLAPTPRS